MDVLSGARLVSSLNAFLVVLSVATFIFCGKKKNEKALPGSPNTLKKSPVAATPGGDAKKGAKSGMTALNETQKTMKSSTTATSTTTKSKTDKAKKDDDDDDDEVQFNINIKKPVEKKDEFDDNEENPLAKLPTKPRGAKKQPKAGGAKQAKVAQEETAINNAECPFLAPNEKQIGASCYQFEPSAGTPAPAGAPARKGAPPNKAAGEQSPAPPPPPAQHQQQQPQPQRPRAVPSNEQANTKSCLSMNLRKNRTKTAEQPEHSGSKEQLEKTQN